MFLDFHCDTLLKTARKNISQDLWENPSVAIDFSRMKRAGQTAEFFAIFMDTKEKMEKMGIDFPSDDAYIDGRLQSMAENLSRHSERAALATNAQTLRENQAAGKISIFLTLEEGRAVATLEKLQRFYEKGIRLITLTWNYENLLGAPNSFDPVLMQKGLTPYGKEVVCRMEELGMLVDVSHLSDGGFWDVVKYSNKPFVASHSNARELSPHPRNLTDDMIRALADKGGVTGLNFCAGFLDRDIYSENSTVEAMVRHVEYIINAGGEDCMALGSDFDGIGGRLEIQNPSQVEYLFEALEKRGMPGRILDKIAYGNMMRVLRDTL